MGDAISINNHSKIRMNTQNIEALESYFKTENEHWNGYTFKMLCEVLQQGQFENPEIPLQLFSDGIGILSEQPETPLKAVKLFNTEIDKEKFSPMQKLFVFEWVYKYLQQSEFDEDLTPIKNLLKSQIGKLKIESQQIKPLTKNLRESLKEMMQQEIETLPKTLKALDPVQRLNILCKLMPFVLPKVESITHTQDEPKGTKNNWFE